MVVQTLRHQSRGKHRFLARALLDLGALVLEPDLDLGLVEAQLLSQILATFLREVAVLVELPLQPVQLLSGEGCPGALLVRRGLGLFGAPRAWTW